MAPTPGLRGRALKALARREHSRAELFAKLQPHAQDPGELGRLLDELEQRGWLSEERFVEQVLTVRRRRFGAARILHELREKGVSGERLEAARSQLIADEVEAARAIWKKKFPAAPTSPEDRARQARFLAGRGFSAETVHKVLKGGNDQ